jgi:hypothetical protein
MIFFYNSKRKASRLVFLPKFSKFQVECFGPTSTSQEKPTIAMPKKLAMDKAKCPIRWNKSKKSLYLFSIHSILPIVEMSKIKVEMKAKIAPNIFMVIFFL